MKTYWYLESDVSFKLFDRFKWWLRNTPRVSLAEAMYVNRIIKAQLVNTFMTLSNQEGNFLGLFLFVVLVMV